MENISKNYNKFFYCCVYTGTLIGFIDGIFEFNLNKKNPYYNIFNNIINGTFDGFLTGLIWPVGVPMYLLTFFDYLIKNKKKFIVNKNE